MFQKLVNRNEDLRRLVERGYAMSFDSGYIVVRDIPYLDQERKLNVGAIVTKLEFVDQERVVQVDHQIFFAGAIPHEIDGTPIRNLGGGPTALSLGEPCKDVVVQRSFSNKPKATGRFDDFYHKIDSYVTIISGPAMALFPEEANPYTFRTVVETQSESVFHFQDTLTSRAEIGDLSVRFHDDTLAVIGLGGTGSYLLDYIVKIPAREIRGFDRDPYRVHNAFRSPGSLIAGELGKSKAEVYLGRYANFRKNLKIEAKHIIESSQEELADVTFAFVCVDEGPSRKAIFDALLNRRIPFIDVGMGLKRKGGGLNGMVRTTYYSVDEGAATRDKGLADLSQENENVYRTNVQIAELNALNAALAVIKYKQVRGFYLDTGSPYHFLLEIADLKIVS